MEEIERTLPANDIIDTEPDPQILTEYLENTFRALRPDVVRGMAERSPRTTYRQQRNDFSTM